MEDLRHDAGAAVTAFLQGAGTAHPEVAAGAWGEVVEDVGGAPLGVLVRSARGERDLMLGLLVAAAGTAPGG